MSRCTKVRSTWPNLKEAEEEVERGQALTRLLQEEESSSVSTDKMADICRPLHSEQVMKNVYFSCLTKNTKVQQ